LSKGSEAEKSVRTVYDVVLLHPTDGHLLTGEYKDLLPMGSHRCLDLSEVTLQWKAADKNLNYTALSCDCVHRLTPLSVSNFLC
jgi:hypothetical protein